MTILAIVRELVGEPKKNGSAYNSPCPFCGGNHRFVTWPDKGKYGAYWCRQCDKKGDAIQLLIEKKGMSFKEAAEYVGKEVKPTRGRAPRAPKEQALDFIPREIADPAELWQAKAAAFMESCHRQLLNNAEQLAWLAARGITLDSVKRFRLGWNPKKLWRKRPEWGVQIEVVKDKETGEGKTLDLMGLPMGLVIPYIVEGRVHRLRIRRPEEGLDDRYHAVKGSGMAPMTIWPVPLPEKGRGAWAVVESELDAILIAQDAGDLVGASALGSVSVKPDGALDAALREAACILNALDADEAGKNRWPWWQAHYPQADRWPVPRGKDPGEYYKAGGYIREWILKGLPYGLRPAPPVIASEVKQSQGETKTPGDETNGAKTETPGDPTCESAPVADSVNLPAPEDEPLAPYDGTWPPITKEQAREQGFTFHETKCEACSEPIILLWPQGQKPVSMSKCFECLKSVSKTNPARRTKWKTAM